MLQSALILVRRSPSRRAGARLRSLSLLPRISQTPTPYVACFPLSPTLDEKTSHVATSLAETAPPAFSFAINPPVGATGSYRIGSELPLFSPDAWSCKVTAAPRLGVYLDWTKQKMKRSFPWEEPVTISLDDSSESDSEKHNPGSTKRAKKDGGSKSIEDISSKGALVRIADMYQKYMKSIPIPTFSASIIAFKSWQGLGRSLKQLYKQPLHYLTNIFLDQLDVERSGSDNELQPLDSIVHPVKAQTIIWLTEELHRHTASPFHLAKLWASDPKYHAHIDPYLSF